MPADTEVHVDTPVGPVVGRRERGIQRFGGVPYARAGRLRVPEPVRWTEPLDATEPGPAPPQSSAGSTSCPA